MSTSDTTPAVPMDGGREALLEKLIEAAQWDGYASDQGVGNEAAEAAEKLAETKVVFLAALTPSSADAGAGLRPLLEEARSGLAAYAGGEDGLCGDTIARLDAALAAIPEGAEPSDPPRLSYSGKPIPDGVDACEACGEPLKSGDMVLDDHNNGGTMHAACIGPERDNYTDGEGGPLKDGDPIPTGYAWEPDAPAIPEGAGSVGGDEWQGASLETRLMAWPAVPKGVDAFSAAYTGGLMVEAANKLAAPSEAQSLRDAVARVLDPLASRYGDPDYFGPDLGKATYSARLRVALKTADLVLAGPIGAHIAKIEAERDQWEKLCDDGAKVEMHHEARADTAEAQVATLTARIADLEAALERIGKLTPEPDDKAWYSGGWGDPAAYRMIGSDGEIYETSAGDAHTEDMDTFGYQRGLHAAAVTARSALSKKDAS